MPRHRTETVVNSCHCLPLNSNAATPEGEPKVNHLRRVHLRGFASLRLSSHPRKRVHPQSVTTLFAFPLTPSKRDSESKGLRRETRGARPFGSSQRSSRYGTYRARFVCGGGVVNILQFYNACGLLLPCCGRLALPCCGRLALPCCGRLALPCCGRLVLPCCGRLALPCCGRLVLPCCGRLVLPCCGRLALPCCGGLMLPCCGGLLPPCGGCLLPPWVGGRGMLSGWSMSWEVH